MRATDPAVTFLLVLVIGIVMTAVSLGLIQPKWMIG